MRSSASISLSTLLALAVLAGAAEPPNVHAMLVLTCTTAPSGEMVLSLGPRTWTARLHMAGAEESGREGRAEGLRRIWRLPGGATTATLETWKRDANGIALTVTPEGAGPACSAPLDIALTPSDAAGLTWWAPWADPEPGPSSDADTKQLSNGQIGDNFWTVKPGIWRDPLVARPWCPEEMLWLGSPMWDTVRQRIGFNPIVEPRIVAAPMVSALDAAAGTGLTLMASLDDPLLDMEIGLSSGALTLRHHRQRFGGARTGTLTALVSTHAAGWRSALAALKQRFPAYIDPPNPQAGKVSGYGAYGSVTAKLDPNAGFQLGVLWRSFDFPYIGMFLPPVADSESWTTWDKRTLDVPTWRAQQRELAGMGIACLDYFNVAEFGKNMGGRGEAPPPGAPLWRGAEGFLRERFPKAALVPWPLKGNGRVMPAVGRPCLGSWDKCIVMDPGDPDWRKFLIEQAKAHVERIPESAGIAIDRFDWMRLYSPDGDDGVSWVEGRSARSVGLSWRALGGDLGAVFHPAGKVIFANNHTKRIDYLRDVDGIFCEFTYSGPALNLTAFCTLDKPAIGWVAKAEQVLADPDAFLQRYLYMGVHPVAPYPKNDHCIEPKREVLPFYRDYNPLFDAIRGRHWVLRDNCITASDGARANLFTTPAGLVAVVLGKEAKVHLSLDRPDEVYQATVLHPGGATMAVPIEVRAGRAHMDVPMLRGCALVRLQAHSPAK